MSDELDAAIAWAEELVPIMEGDGGIRSLLRPLIAAAKIQLAERIRPKGKSTLAADFTAARTQVPRLSIGYTRGEVMREAEILRDGNCKVAAEMLERFQRQADAAPKVMTATPPTVAGKSDTDGPQGAGGSAVTPCYGLVNGCHCESCMGKPNPFVATPHAADDALVREIDDRLAFGIPSKLYPELTTSRLRDARETLQRARDRIAAQDAELARLREALRKIAAGRVPERLAEDVASAALAEGKAK
jgi:hypothetical protein